MQKGIRINESQLIYLSTKARQENSICGYLQKKSSDTGKWQLRWFALYQNLLFYYENDTTAKLSGVALLEGCYCERLVTPISKNKDNEKVYSFAIYYRKEGQRQYDLRADTEPECAAWIEAIQIASFSKVLEQKEQLEQKHLHLLQILDSERQAKWHYVQQTEELAAEVKKLKDELRFFKNERRVSNDKIEDENEEIRKIKKVQSFFRGWLCRRRWKQIVDEYIRSDHAESMRKRNSIMFGMVECEEEYVKQISSLVTVFLRPLRMAASSKKPPITHEDVNSIFLNSETLLFLHQIFLKGLMARMENWPTLVLGDLFDMLLPMLGIYQEYVRNHHYSLQVLAEYKQKSEFNQLLRRYEEKPICEGRSLETFLTYPMHQIPRYIITIHELLAHTPHDHVERKSLEFAQSKLEELSQIMQDEVSETENIRKNLAIERMIVEGCDILLDMTQTFVRQGSLLQAMGEKPKSGWDRPAFIKPFKDKKEMVRQTFLFTNHILLTTRANNGRLHLAKHYGKIPLLDCTLIEDPNSDNYYFDDDASSCDSISVSLPANSNSSSNLVNTGASCEKDQRLDYYNGVDFRLIVDCKTGPPVTVTLVASTLQEKAAWCSDISQCIENLHYSDLLNSSMSETSSVTMPQSVNSRNECSSSNVSSCSNGSNTGSPGNVVKRNHVGSHGHDLDGSPDLELFTEISQGSPHTSMKELTDSQRLKLPKITAPNPESLLPAMIARSDPKLFRDDVDIKFSRTLNSCKVPQIRHASVDRLLDRLTDLRFLSIDFLNTFLLTYRVFASGHTVLEALKRVYRNPEYGNLDSNLSLSSGSQQEIMYRHSFDTSAMTALGEQNHQSGTSRVGHVEFSNLPPQHAKNLIKPQAEKLRRISTGCMKIEVTGEKTTIDGGSHSSFQKYERQDSSGHSSSSSTEEPPPPCLLIPPKPKLAPIASCETLSETSEFVDDGSESGSDLSGSPDDYTTPGIITVMPGGSISETSSPTTITLRAFPCGESNTDDSTSLIASMENNTLTVPGGLSSLSGCSSETLVNSPVSCQTLSTATSSDTLVPVSPRSSPLSNISPSSPRHSSMTSLRLALKGKRITATPVKIPSSKQLDALALSPATSPKFGRTNSPFRRATSPCSVPDLGRAISPIIPQCSTPSPVHSLASSPKLKRAPSPISYSYSSPNIITNLKLRAGKRGSAESDITTLSSPRSSFATVSEGSPPTAKAGTVVTSSRASKRRMSNTAATAAFAAATAGSANPKDQPKTVSRLHSTGPAELKAYNLNKKRESVISTAATMRVLSVLRHWVSKHSQDFDSNNELKAKVKDLLEEMVCNTNLLPAEHKAAASILRVLLTKEEAANAIDLNTLLLPPTIPSKDTFDTLSALDIAEQLTYLDHQIFMKIRSEELLSQAWMKPDKSEKAPHVLLVSKRFNEVSRLVVSEIISRQNLQERVSCIEKWAAIADICRCMHNYNGVLQICAAFVNSSVYRLKKTWEKISKQTKQMIERLQTLVSSDGRFKNMRDALHRCDPPCIPYLGMYLTDLSFIEEGTPNVTEESRLVNFSKMRMIAHVIREIQLFQQTPYRIEHHKRVTNYLLDTTRLLGDEETYRASLEIEPRQPRVSMSGQSMA